jgi:hypothetical protein
MTWGKTAFAGALIGCALIALAWKASQDPSATTAAATVEPVAVAGTAVPAGAARPSPRLPVPAGRPDPADFLPPDLPAVVRAQDAPPPPPAQAEIYARVLGTADQDGDGRLSLAEIENDERVGALAPLLAGSDHDGDGHVSESEFTSFGRRLFAGRSR